MLLKAAKIHFMISFKLFSKKIAILLCLETLFFSSCHRPTPTPTPSPTPLAVTETWTPQVGENVFVAKSFTIEIDNAIIGFRLGKSVNIIETNGDLLTISDGKNIATKPLTFFVKNIKDLQSSNPISTAKPAQSPNIAASIPHSPSTTPTTTPKPTPNPAIAAAKQNLERLQYRIKVARQERYEKGFPPDGGSRNYNSYNYNNNYRIVSLSVDASQIKKLLEAENELKIYINKLIESEK